MPSNYICSYSGIHAKMVNLFGPQVKITEAYASTETGVISGVPEDMDKKLGLLGQLHTGVQVNTGILIEINQG